MHPITLKVGLSAFIVSVIIALQQLVHLIRDYWWRILFVNAHLLSSTNSLFMTSLIFYSGIKVLLGLRKSHEFQSENSSQSNGGGKKYQRLAIMVIYPNLVFSVADT